MSTTLPFVSEAGLFGVLFVFCCLGFWDFLRKQLPSEKYSRFVLVSNKKKNIS